jgi:hypothetical protein
VPAALFKDFNTLRTTEKSALIKELLKKVNTNDESVSEGNALIVDGGWLLHKVKWQHGGTYIKTWSCSILNTLTNILERM